MAASPETIILQNYSTPYRHDLFEALGTILPGLTVVHSQRPADEGRQWAEQTPTAYRVVAAPRLKIGPVVAFGLPFEILVSAHRKSIVLHDDNPANLSMVLWGSVLRLLGARPKLWVEHVPDATKTGGKALYQKLCSQLLLGLCDEAIAFSAMSERYVRGLNRKIRIARMVQTVPAATGTTPDRHGPVRRFGFMGSDQGRKNLTLLLEAFAGLDGPYELHIAGLKPRDHADQRVRWWGYVDADVRERFFNSVDMLVLPSSAEPWGLVVNEALERGCLAMASTACGSSELTAAVDPALVFEPTITGIAAALRTATELDADVLRGRVRAALVPYGSSAGARRLLEIIAPSDR
jgi:hypothetical protein